MTEIEQLAAVIAKAWNRPGATAMSIAEAIAASPAPDQRRAEREALTKFAEFVSETRADAVFGFGQVTIATKLLALSFRDARYPAIGTARGNQ